MPDRLEHQYHKSLGICPHCRRAEAVTGTSSCQRCRDQARANSWAYYHRIKLGEDVTPEDYLPNPRERRRIHGAA